VTIADTAAKILIGTLAPTPGETVAGSTYAITQGTLAASSNCTITFTGSTLTITPAPLTIAAEPETKVFGSADPTMAYTSGGFRFSDTASTVLTGSLVGPTSWSRAVPTRSARGLSRPTATTQSTSPAVP
jgi:large repetitive protein